MKENYIFRGKWIQADMSVEDRFSPVFRKTISLDALPDVAELYICGLGLFELKVNGQLPDDAVLNPAHSQYDKSVLYLRYDILPLLREGENEITVELGHFFYNDTVSTWQWDTAAWRDVPKLICDINLVCGDERISIVSDESWAVATDGIITSNSIYYGEDHDYRRQPHFDSSAIPAKAPEGELSPQYMEPMRRIGTFSPAEVTSLGNGTYIIKPPEMTTGWAMLRMNIPYGETVTLTYGERLLPSGEVVHIGKGEGRDGNWYPDDYMQQDTFTGDGTLRDYEPKFSYKGFRYIQIDNCPETPDETNVFIYRVANDVEEIAELQCSEPLINDLHALMKRTILNNLQGKPTDTPVWEKNGWLGDLNCGLISMIYNFDMKKHLESFSDTMKDCYYLYGNVPVLVPVSNWGLDEHPVWNTVFVFNAEAIMDFYGDREYIEEIYPHIRAFALRTVEQIEKRGWVWDHKGLADWVAPIGRSADDEANPNSSEGAEICASAFVYRMLGAMVRIAEYLGKVEDIDGYEASARSIYEAFNKAFYNAEKGIYETSFWKQMGERTRYRQTSNLLPLAFGMVPEEYKNTVLGNLVKDIEDKDCHFDTGCTGTRFVLPVLFDNGYDKLAYKILTQTTFPSWGLWVKDGTDSAWESWERTTRSLDHYFLGTYEEALFSHLAGIRNVRDGYREFDFKPYTDCGLQWLSLKLKTPRGTIKCSWNKNPDGTTDINLDVPEGVKVNRV